MNILLYGVGLGAIFFCGWKILQKDDARSRHKAWMIDHSRRQWREGTDGQSWDWDTFKHRKVS